MVDILEERRAGSAKRLKAFQEKLKQAAAICKKDACVYLIGSYGRGEGGLHSDLDLFIAGRSHVDKKGKEQRHLSKLDEICLKTELIRASESLHFPKFSGDGEYVVHYTIDQLVKTTGKPDDDATNTFTARLLLLLESKPLIGETVYNAAINAVISKYWGDYEDHKRDFTPGFLANDILRLWRTFCVNYEATTASDPPGEKNKRRLKNYKLKYSRMLTCYSALIYLLATHNRKGSVSPQDARKMVAKTPTERLEWLLTLKELESAHDGVRTLLAKYAEFLSNTNADKATMLKRIGTDATRKKYQAEAIAFGDAIFDLVKIVGDESRLHRLLVV